MCDKKGKLLMMDAKIFSNGGCSLDLSGPYDTLNLLGSELKCCLSLLFRVMDRALFHIDNCYRWPVLSVEGVVCRTNLPSNTAFRGFGGPQAIVFTEVIFDV